MRAFLQRAEVRLSTMHRVGGVFLNGAGLLVLFPVFFTGVIQRLAEQLVGQAHLIGTLWSDSLLSFFAAAIVLVVTAISILLSIGLPIAALYLLVRDIVHFYFSAHHYGFLHEEWFHPRFILPGMAFSPDEGPAVKTAVFERERERGLLHYLLPFDRQSREYYDGIIAATKKTIIPSTRRKAIEDYARSIQGQPPEKVDVSVESVERLHAAFGLAGVVDHDLTEEVAKMEMALVRHALGLRRLVIRYFKALIMFTWTTVVSIGMVIFLPKMPHQIWGTIIFACGYMLWCALMPFLVRLPVRWIYMHGDRHTNEEDVQRDAQLVSFENTVIRSSKIGLVTWAAASLTIGVLLIVKLCSQ